MKPRPDWQRYQELIAGRDGAPAQETTPQRPQPAAPPRVQTEIALEPSAAIEIARFSRGPRHDRDQEVVRLILETWTPPDADAPVRYVAVRIWWRAQDGSYRPSQRGLTIRAGEIVAAIRALESAARMLGIEIEPHAEAPRDGGDR